MARIVLASHNSHKLQELRAIIGSELGVHQLIGYDGPAPVEDGTTFAENALIKARAAAAHTGLPALADDSGIAVDILGGSPGIFSARWGGPARDDRQNLELLLWQLKDVAPAHRAAQFVCAAAYVLPDGSEHAELGVWPGRVLTEPDGENGFGYDPIFAPEGEERSSAGLSSGEKNLTSHRARAFRTLVPGLIARLEE
ncbi:RdgB/HAM1 family non-canonical purine NTP pyrophosphatase [Lysinibacter sp. HNR]|uniref:RdgB/HAM1 family non-canonical purine NTP pyrophosphatase n=1 Tax=Lysinibacter sp. HNR TaxID=3031408 RepID=UPI0024358B28|nr:RdgB/HAM1 family non-canonical purine NTP pyrophosphatase [Lysinibacter sp. HNR]WGD38661.1 RdgB/HAM1 family non-canonical purine NTP pyrophosphatase [Lysinibacter sp. HNR]